MREIYASEDAYMGYMHPMVHKNSNPELLGGK